MQAEIYSDLLRATARFTPDGRPVDRNRDHLMAFRQARKGPAAATAAKGPGRLRTLLGALWQRPHAASAAPRKPAPAA
ncbi:hypothetical protein [Chachezhania sediminis]|uniref:hypothetical protein n=1 Tax=Chachezhania sediminis TaxID=2599291 RepID=UPI00131CE333|nr:hypothetical protein [Chachezhania sediminis]